MRPLREVLGQRQEVLRLNEELGDWQAITIKFSGEVLPRDRSTAFKGAMFAAYPGDLVFSKIDARNGAVGLIPGDIPKAVVTSEYPVLIPDAAKLRPAYLNYLLRAQHFKTALMRKASGTSGRKRVAAEGFLELFVPVPDLREQDRLVAAYVGALEHSTKLESEAKAIEDGGLLVFEGALGAPLSSALPKRPVFVARFKNVERWSHESILRSIESADGPNQSISCLARLGDVVRDFKVGWSPKCLERAASVNEWGVLKLSAVTTGEFNDSANKALPTKLQPQPELEVRPGDVLITRGSGVTRLVGATVFVESTRTQLMICDLMYRVVFHDNSPIVPRYLAEVLRTPFLRKQIEERRTGDAPMMQKITKTALLELTIPLPDIGVQRELVNDLLLARSAAKEKREAALRLRQTAWAAFESSVFSPTEKFSA